MDKLHLVSLLLLSSISYASTYSEAELSEFSAALLHAQQQEAALHPIAKSKPQLAAMSGSGLNAQNVKLMTELALSRMEVSEQITPETTALFGDRVDLNSGSISFQHQDVRLPGNSNLPVQLQRAYRGSKNNRGNNASFGDWVLEIPSISTTTLEYRHGFISHIPHCGELSPDYVDTGFATVGPAQYWSGDFLDIPGVTNQKLRQSYNATGMITGRVADNWRIECLTDRYGFRATSPEGTVYIFDVVRLVPASLISVAQEAESVDPNYPLEVILRTFSLNVQVSSITDRFGNWVRYHYEATSMPPGIAASMLTYSNKLRKIEANDGRVIDIFYEAGSHSDRIRRVVAEGKTWTYLYRTEYDVTDQFHKDILHEVVRPDGKKWQFNLAFDKFGGYENSGWMGVLACMNTDHFLPLVSTLTHPDGAVYRLTQRATRFGRTAVPVNLRDHHDVSRCFNNVAVIKKELLLADENLTWQYSYSQNPGSPKGMLEHSNTPQPAPLNGLPFTPAGHHLLDLRSTTTLNPDGSKTVHVFDRKFGVLEGEEVLTLHYDTDGSSLLQSVRKTFTVQPKTGKVRLVSCKPSQYPVIDIDHNKCLKAFDNQAKEENHRYLHQLLTTQYHNGVGTTFSKEYSHYNSYGQPELIKESSSFGQRFTRNSYQHNTAIWVLNLPLKTEVSADGQNWQTVSETSYYSPAHASRLLPYQQRYFGMLYSTNTYHVDGNIRRQSYNAANRWVEYGHYKRGTPQHIMLPGRYQAASTQSATQVVNNRGEIASVTNFLGQTTHYNYDVMGRLTRITPPSPWQRTEISYANSAGRFIQTISRGQYQKRIEMDALMRPVLTRETDTARNINIFVRQRFDAYNQPVFQSLPSYSSAATSGFVTQYDGLQRRRRYFTNVDNTGTDYYYLAGNRVMTVDAMGNQTTTTYRALGAPEQHLPQHIAQPEGVTTLLAYNLFDNVTSISQGGITESRFYNSQQRLCRVARTDVGATAYEYNAVGDLLWLAQGASGANTGCFTASVLAGEKTSYSYDNIGNIRQITYPDSSGNIVHTYDAQGQLTRLQAGANTWDYLYNSLGLVERESLAVDNLSFELRQSYNAMGQLTTKIYPSGRQVSFSYDALGRALNAGTYATQAQYTPSGQLQAMRFGNGLHFNQSFDSKLRPERRMVSQNHLLLSQQYQYDANNNITAILDAVTPGHSITNMTYDGLDRLKTANGFWGQGSFNYDTLGNITQKTLGSHSLGYSYTAQNRLSAVSGSVNRSFQYDSRGNVTHNGARAFTFNRANRLASSGNISYSYDGHGRRIIKNNNGSKTYSLYNSQGVLMSTYENYGYTDYYYLGSQLVAKYRDPGAQSDNPGYTGHAEDDDLQLTYMQQRYYDPLIGRFYSNDPVGFTPSNPMMFNRYAYANNNPYRYIDPDGREPEFKFEMPSMLKGLPEMFGFESAAEGSSAIETKVDMALEAVSPYPSSGTIEYSVGATLSGGVSGSISVGMVLDSHKNIGIAITAGGGGGTPDAGGGPGVTITNANHIRDLRGFGSVTSVSAGPVSAGAVTAEGGITGYSVGFGRSLAPASASSQITHTWIYSQQ